MFAGNDFSHPSDAGRLQVLSGDAAAATSAAFQEGEGIPELVRERVIGIIKCNAFSPAASFGFAADRRSPMLPSQDRHLGLWVLPAMLNHACVGNCQRFFVGDFMFIRASQVSIPQFSCHPSPAMLCAVILLLSKVLLPAHALDERGREACRSLLNLGKGRPNAALPRLFAPALCSVLDHCSVEGPGEGKASGCPRLLCQGKSKSISGCLVTSLGWLGGCRVGWLVGIKTKPSLTHYPSFASSKYTSSPLTT